MRIAFLAAPVAHAQEQLAVCTQSTEVAEQPSTGEPSIADSFRQHSWCLKSSCLSARLGRSEQGLAKKGVVGILPQIHAPMGAGRSSCADLLQKIEFKPTLSPSNSTAFQMEYLQLSCCPHGLSQRIPDEECRQAVPKISYS